MERKTKDSKNCRKKASIYTFWILSPAAFFFVFGLFFFFFPNEILYMQYVERFMGGTKKMIHLVIDKKKEGRIVSVRFFFPAYYTQLSF